MCGNPARACSPKSEWGGFMPAPAFGVKINLSYSSLRRNTFVQPRRGINTVSPPHKPDALARGPTPPSLARRACETASYPQAASLAGDVDLLQLLDTLFQLILALEDQF